MLSEFAPRKIAVALIIFIFLGLLTRHIVAAAPDLAVNQAAIQLVRLCVGSNAAGDQVDIAADRSSDLRLVWFSVGRYRCLGDKAATNEALQHMLVLSAARMDLMSTIAPNDVALATSATTLYPGRGAAYFWLGDAQVTNHMPEAALTAYERGLTLDPTNANSWDALGRLYQNVRSDLQAAVVAYDHACQYVDRGKNGCFEAGEVYMKLARYDLALASYQASIRQIGYFWSGAEWGAVKALLALGRPQEAIPHLRLLAQHGSAVAQEQLTQLEEQLK